MAGKTKVKTSFAISFFDRMSKKFRSGPQDYYRSFGKRKATRYRFGNNHIQALSEE